MTLHHVLDWEYGPDGLHTVKRLIADGAEVDGRFGPLEETPLHVATRRRRCEAIEVLLDHGAQIDLTTAGGKTAFAHAVRRGFDDVVYLLTLRGADQRLAAADRFAIAVLEGRLSDARAILREHPGVARTGNPEEDRVFADAAGRNDNEPVSFLVEVGGDLHVTGLDQGTPLHQAAWFGQPRNARILVEAGADLDAFDPVHRSSPLHWAVHGSRYSGGASDRLEAYAEIVQLLLAAGAGVRYPGGDEDGEYLRRLRTDAPPEIRGLLPE
ncbi:MAG: hypothetical protein HKN72_17595 [Gemmatimonadetes bacterium]|nr:hypothetical protein [Gemmatimonadota bacterium]